MPDGPIGSRETRIRKALHWYWTRDLTQAEIGEKLGVSGRKVREYLHEAPQSDAVKEQLDTLEAEVRFTAAEELRQQLKAAGEQARSAEHPVKIYQTDDGDLVIQEQRDDAGHVVDRFAVPVDLEMGPDETARYYRREEVREILDLLTDIVGAKAAERHELEHSGGVEATHDVTIQHVSASDVLGDDSAATPD